MTHVDNLVNILEKGKLLAKSRVKNNQRTTIASEEVQSRREKMLVSKPPGGVLHDYVPFYFAPRVPMLYCNHMGSIPNACDQKDIIYLVTTAQKLATETDFVFYDRHAVLSYAECFNQLDDLSKIDWRIFFENPHVGGYTKYWQDKQDNNHPHWDSCLGSGLGHFLNILLCFCCSRFQILFSSGCHSFWCNDLVKLI